MTLSECQAACAADDTCTHVEANGCLGDEHNDPSSCGGRCYTFRGLADGATVYNGLCVTSGDQRAYAKIPGASRVPLAAALCEFAETSSQGHFTVPDPDVCTPPLALSGRITTGCDGLRVGESGCTATCDAGFVLSAWSEAEDAAEGGQACKRVSPWESTIHPLPECFPQSPQSAFDLFGLTATQSTTGAGGIASRAIDGNDAASWGSGSCTHTHDQWEPWWQVDLGRRTHVGEVTLTSRSDCCGTRLSDLDVTLDGVVCATNVDVAQGRTLTVSCGASGRLLRVQIKGRNDVLTICEIGIDSLMPITCATGLRGSDGLPGPTTDETCGEADSSVARFPNTAVCASPNGRLQDECCVFRPENNAILIEAVQACLTVDPTGVDCSSSSHGISGARLPMGSWDVSGLTDLSSVFKDDALFNADVSGWDVSSATNLQFIFSNAGSFNGDISAWDTANVENMKWMFEDASVFNADISNWDVTSVTDMNWMFAGSAINQDISAWDTSRVTDMNGMFTGSAFNQDISAWDVSSVTYPIPTLQHFPTSQSDTLHGTIDSIRIVVHASDDVTIRGSFSTSMTLGNLQLQLGAGINANGATLTSGDLPATLFDGRGMRTFCRDVSPDGFQWFVDSSASAISTRCKLRDIPAAEYSCTPVTRGNLSEQGYAVATAHPAGVFGDLDPTPSCYGSSGSKTCPGSCAAGTCNDVEHNVELFPAATKPSHFGAVTCRPGYGGSMGVSVGLRCSYPGGGTFEPYGCEPCSSGTYSDSNDVTPCKPCEVGEYNTAPGRHYCDRCAVDADYSDAHTTSAEGLTWCDSCVADHYRGKDGMSCLKCDESEGIDCKGTGVALASLKLKSGFWRQTLDSETVEACEARPKGCKGGVGAGNDLCNKEYKGPLCAECADNHFSDGKTCSPCGDTEELTTSVVVAVVFCLLVILACGLSLSTRGRQLRRKSWNIYENKMNRVLTDQRKGIMAKLKVAITFWQILLSLPMTLDLEFPEYFEKVSSALSFVQLDVISYLPLDCVTSTNALTRLITVTVAPLAIVGVLVAMSKMLRRRKDKVEANNYVYAAIFLLYTIFPPTAATVFGCLRECHELEDGKKYMHIDYSIECSSTEYKIVQGVAWLMVAVYPIGVPVSFFLLLWAQKEAIIEKQKSSAEADDGTSAKQEARPRSLSLTSRMSSAALSFKKQVGSLSSVKVVARRAERFRKWLPKLDLDSFGLLFDGYTVWWWEVFESLRRMALTGFLMLCDQGSGVQVLVGTVASIAALKMFIYVKPLRGSDNDVAEQAQWATTIVFVFAMLLRMDTSEEGETDRKIYGVLLCVLLFSVPVMIIGLGFISWRAMRNESASREPEPSDASASASSSKTKKQLGDGAHVGWASESRGQSTVDTL